MTCIDGYAPIVLFVFNRPEHTRRLVASLLANAESECSDLFIYSDAARDECDTVLVGQVRDFITSVSGFKSITIVKQDRNLGLANSVISGVSRLCADFGRAIVLEDDLVLSPRFLCYMNAALERYQHERSVMQISGHMFPVDVGGEGETFFLPFISTWGWATWGRAWSQFDISAAGYEKLKADKVTRDSFDLDRAYPYFKMLEKQRRGKINSWGILWNLSVFIESGVVLYPSVSFVNNMGFDGSGTHCNAVVGANASTELSYSREIRFPNEFVVDCKKLNVISSYLRGRNSLMYKMIVRFFPFIGKYLAVR